MTEWIKQAATQILPLAASGICNDEDGNVKPTADVIEEIIHDAYMDRDGELRDMLCCPPDCDLTSWAKRLGNFWHDLEGGQVVESLKQQLAEANVEQIAKDHRAMDVMRAKKYAPMPCNPQHGDGWYVRDRSGKFVGKWGAEAETDPADAIIAAAWRPLEGGSGRRVGNGHDT